MDFSFSNMLSPVQWVVLAAVPPAIIALYFLKLKREPLEVPSTYLWHKSVEDLYVNSIWQRLRQSLLLILQLLLVALLMLALLRPGWRADQLEGDRFIFMVDNSASMSSTDEPTSRLAEAKKRVAAKIDAMPTGAAAMLLSFADGARVEQMFTESRADLRKRLEDIKPTHQRTSLNEALRVASGLANPGRSATEITDTQVAEALPATLYILTDGRFDDVTDFSLGNLTAEPGIILGASTARNIGIVAFGVGRSEGTSGKFEAFGQLTNFSAAETVVPVQLLLDNELIDADEVTVPPNESVGVSFAMGETEGTRLELRIDAPDDFPLDDRAWAILKQPRRATVLFVTAGNAAVEFCFDTDRARELAQIVQKSPEYLKTSEFTAASAGGAYDLMIFDRCQPAALPQANTLFMGALPPGDLWKQKEVVYNPAIIDTDHQHPLTQLVEMGNVQIAESRSLIPPSGATTLIDAPAGPLLAISPREGFEDAVLGFPLYVTDENQLVRENTTWPLRVSFPVFVLNVLQYLGEAEQATTSAGGTRPSQQVTLRPETAADAVTVITPDGREFDVPRGGQNQFDFHQADQVGVYEVRAKGGKEALTHFAVNLFDATESNILPREKFQVGYVEISGERKFVAGRRDLWKMLVFAGVVILLIEWYIYNRRVFI